MANKSRITANLVSNTGISTFTDLNITNFSISGIGTITNGTVTNLTGTSSTITTLRSTTGNFTTGNIVTGVTTNFTSTNGSITNLTGTAGTVTTLRSTTLNADTGNIVTGVTTNFTSTNGSITNLTGTAGTVTTLRSTTGNFTTGNIVTGVTTNFTSTNVVITGVTTVSAGTALLPSITPSGDSNTGIFFPAADTIAVTSGGSERGRIDSNGRLGIGTNVPQAKIDVRNSSNAPNCNLTSDQIGIVHNSNASVGNQSQPGGFVVVRDKSSAVDSNDCFGGLSWAARSDAENRAGFASILSFAEGSQEAAITFNTSGASLTTSEKVRLTGSGRVGIGTSVPGSRVEIMGRAASGGISGDPCIFRVHSVNDWGDISNAMVKFDGDSNGSGNGDGNILLVKGGISRSDAEIFDVNNRDGNKFRVRGDGAVIVAGSLSKGSGSFVIDHPLENLSKTHNLIHSFIEGPRADLIYRGKIRLISGIATVIMDESVGLTTGTWKLLCRDPDVFVTNNDDWTPVKAEITPTGILTIQAQNDTCTSKINWLVIAERHDKHMYDTEWTDENGRPILEPRKREKDIVGIASTSIENSEIVLPLNDIQSV